MPTFEELLRASLERLNQEFEAANIILLENVFDTAKAVEAVTEGQATVRLSNKKCCPEETRYDLVLFLSRVKDSRTLATLGVTVRGFPIIRYGFAAGAMGAVEQFESADSVNRYFQKLAWDPDSQLVGYLAFIIRNADELFPL